MVKGLCLSEGISGQTDSEHLVLLAVEMFNVPSWLVVVMVAIKGLVQVFAQIFPAKWN